MKRKGFTLIELLAVIIVLAIIALIATPIVMGVIKNAKKGAAERSADNFLRAAEIAISEQRLNGPIEDGLYLINEDGMIQYNDTNIKVDVSKDKITSGYIVIENGQIKKATVKNNEMTLNYDETGYQKLDIWDGAIEEIKKEEDGYHITKGSQLAWIAQQVLNGNNLVGETIYLEADLDLDNKEWIPIGRSQKHFKGNFEGNDHVIMNIKIAKPQDETIDNQYVGLFGYSYDSIIKDLTLVNVDISGHSRVGGLTGIARSSIISNINLFNINISCSERCGSLVGMTNNNTSIQNISSNNSHVEGLMYVGGVIGYLNTSTVSDTYSNSTVDTQNSTERLSATGGIIGYSYQSSLSNLISKATVIGNSDLGGVVGHIQTNSTLINVTSYAKVTGVNQVGGVIGINNAYQAVNSLENVKSYANVTGTNEVGGIIAKVAQGVTIFKNSYAKANITGTENVGSLIGGFENSVTELQYFNLISDSTLNTEYKSYNNLFGCVYDDNITVLKLLNE